LTPTYSGGRGRFHARAARTTPGWYHVGLAKINDGRALGSGEVPAFAVAVVVPTPELRIPLASKKHSLAKRVALA